MAVIAMTREIGTLGKDVAAGLAERLGLDVIHHEAHQARSWSTTRVWPRAEETWPIRHAPVNGASSNPGRQRLGQKSRRLLYLQLRSETRPVT